MSEPKRSFGQLLRAARPDHVPEAAARFLADEFATLRAEILLADYRIFGLWPLLEPANAVGGLLTDRTAAGRAFDSQRTVVETAGNDGGTRVLVPLTIWSDRLGVLVVEVDEAPNAARLDALRAVADELAVLLAVADRSTDRYRLVRRRQRLTMAAEMQWDLLPGRALGGDNFVLAAQLEPAYAVSGDHFDWSLDGQRLTVTVLNGDGIGIDATMLTALAVTAIRNGRRSGGNLVGQAELASDVVYGVQRGERSVATLLMEIDLDTGLVNAIDAGSAQAFRLRGPQAMSVKLDPQLPLGMFADTRYEMQTFSLQAGERLFVVSDGVHAAAPAGRESFGEGALLAALRGTRLQPATEAVGSVMRVLQEYHADDSLVDDAVVVCLDWQGGPADVAPGQA